MKFLGKNRVDLVTSVLLVAVFLLICAAPFARPQARLVINLGTLAHSTEYKATQKLCAVMPQHPHTQSFTIRWRTPPGNDIPPSFGSIEYRRNTQILVYDTAFINIHHGWVYNKVTDATLVAVAKEGDGPPYLMTKLEHYGCAVIDHW